MIIESNSSLSVGNLQSQQQKGTPETKHLHQILCAM